MSTLYVDNLRSNLSTKITVPNGNTLDVSGGTLVPSSGQIVKYTHDSATTQQTISTGVLTNVYTYPSYTPVLTTSTVIYSFRVMYRSYQSAGADGRSQCHLIVDGTTVVEAKEIGNYDYGNSGAWHNGSYTSAYAYSNTDGSAISAEIKMAVLNAQGIDYNPTGSGSTTRSFYEILEIAP